MNLKVCFIGLGSIGMRHLKNFHYLCDKYKWKKQIDVLSSNPSKVYSDVDHVYYSYELLPSDYDIIFITNPTSLHLHALIHTKGKAKFYFVEKPVFANYQKNIPPFLLEKHSFYYVACPLRYTNVIQYIKNNICADDILSVRSICSSYLPSWRPNVDYRNIYSAKREMGGGVVIDLIHELDYITYLFGFPKYIKGFECKTSSLEIDCEDCAEYIIKYKDKLMQLHLDYFGKIPRRQIEIITVDDVIIGDLNNNYIFYMNDNNKISFDETINDRYVKELEYFFTIVQGENVNKNDIIHSNQVLNLAECTRKEKNYE